VTIEAYLAELRALLPATRRERFLAEVEAHLRDAADAGVERVLDRPSAEAEAAAVFGRPSLVAARMRRETAPIAIRRAAGMTIAALSLLFLPLYAIPENVLPPAPWDERPAYLGVLLGVALVSWLSALGLAGLAILLRPRRAAVGLLVSALAAVVSGTAGLTTALAWHVEAADTPWSVLGLAIPLTLTSLVGVVAAARWARGRDRDVA